MGEAIKLFAFGDNDRSGKVRWTACELGLDVLEERVAFGQQRKPPYVEINPYGHVPTVEFRGELLRESTAICQTLAETIAEPKLFVAPGEPARRRYLYWLAVFGETLEARLVECAISRAGIVGPEYFTLHERGVRYKLRALVKELPRDGYLCGERFTIADVLAGYGLRLAVQTELVARADIEPYFGRLLARPAAVKSRIFAGVAT